MKSIIKPSLLAVCISCTLLSSLSVMAKEGAKRKGPLSAIELSEEQKAALKELAPAGPRRNRHSNPMRLFAPVVFSEELDSTQLSLIVDAAIAKRKAQGLIAAEKRFNVKQILSEQQQAEIKSAIQERRNKKPGQSFEQRLTQRLALSDEQLSQMQPSFAQIAQLRSVANSEKEAFKAFEESLFAQDEFDSDAWLAQFDLVASNMQENMLSLATHTHTIYNLLNDQQQRKLKRFMLKSKRKGDRKKRG